MRAGAKRTWRAIATAAQAAAAVEAAAASIHLMSSIEGAAAWMRAIHGVAPPPASSHAEGYDGLRLCSLYSYEIGDKGAGQLFYTLSAPPLASQDPPRDARTAAPATQPRRAAPSYWLV